MFSHVASTPAPEVGGMLPAADTIRVRDSNPLLSIFFYPRATIRHVVSTNPELHLAVLITLAAFFNSLDRASGRNFGDRISMWMIIGLSLLFAPIAVPLSKIGAIVSRWLGAKLGGVATREQVRASMAWSAVPAIAGSMVFVPIPLVVFGEEMFRSETPLMDDSNPLVVLGLLLLPLVFAIWSVITALQTYAEVNKFSAWRSLGAGLLGMVLLLGPIVAIALAIAVVT